MSSRAVMVVVALCMFAACKDKKADSSSGGITPTTPPPTTSSSTTKREPSAAAEAAFKVTDLCALLPERVAALVPGAGPPVKERDGKRCSVNNGTAAIEITIAGAPIQDPPADAELIPGLGQSAYAQRLSADKSGVYLTVVLGPYPQNIEYRNLHLIIDLNKHDKDDAVAIARDILTRLK